MSTRWSDEDVEAFISSGSSLEHLREDDLREGNFGFLQWRRICTAYGLSADGSVAAMAARLREQRRRNLDADESNNTTLAGEGADDDAEAIVQQLIADMRASQEQDQEGDGGESPTRTTGNSDALLAHLDQLYSETREILTGMRTPNQPMSSGQTTNVRVINTGGGFA